MATNDNPRFCYDSVGTGCLHEQTCRLRHDIRRCSCGLVLLNAVVASHLAGRRHRLLLAQFKQAPNGGHQTNPDQMHHPLSDPNTMKEPGDLALCNRCGKALPAALVASHVKWHVKMRKKLFSDAEAMAAEAEENKNEVTVSHKEGIDFGVVGTEASVYIDITVLKTRWTPSGIVLETISRRRDESNFFVALAGKNRWVKHNEARTLSVEFHPSFDGEYQDVLELIFLDTSTRKRFLITRKLCAVVGSEDDHTQLKPKAAYTRRRPAPFQFNGPIIRSLRPPNWGPIKWTSRLLEYKSPDKLIQAAFGPHSGSNTKAVLQAVKGFMPSTFTVNTYGTHFQVMLYIEDEQMRYFATITAGLGTPRLSTQSQVCFAAPRWIVYASIPAEPDFNNPRSVDTVLCRDRNDSGYYCIYCNRFAMEIFTPCSYQCRALCVSMSS
ncbi:hypothetical protein C8R43DRAFT_887088 [Mycena crocata]|nr:hypothetical protein C8R43DRAFT_887088 [Mycena crocata]